MDGKDRNILVIGAGMAGLGAARVLADAGARVTVIEARDRIGGRTHTSHVWPDLQVDMGASWIHGTTGNPMTALAHEVGLKLTPTTYARSVTFDQHGKKVAFITSAKRTMKLVEKARDRIDGHDSDMSLRDAIVGSQDWLALSPADRRIARLAINTRIEHEYSGDWTLLSARHFDDGAELVGDESVVTPGFGPILTHLARGLDIRLGEAVTGLAPQGQGVKVTTTRGTYLADRAVLTVPLGVLQAGKIRFAAPLAISRQRAIDYLKVGLLNKCVLRFDRAFWPADKDWIDYLGPAETLWADWTNYLPATGQPLLVGFNAAQTADDIEALDDADTTASAMAALRAMFGNSIPDPVGSQISRWRADPFALGSYSFAAVGSSHKDRSALFGADWDGRLQFAGEATSPDYPATVHGALITGRKAAAAVLGEG